MDGLSVSLETGTNGREMIMDEASAKKVVSTSWVRFHAPYSNIIDSKIRRVVAIILSHNPPMGEE